MLLSQLTGFRSVGFGFSSLATLCFVIKSFFQVIMLYHWILRASSCAWLGFVHITASKVYASDVFEKPTSKWNYDWDNPVQEEKVFPSRFKNNIIMIRSAQSHYASTVKRPRALTALGEIQASETGSRLRDMRVNFSKMYCSCLPRTQQTANIIESFLGKVPVEVSDLLDGGIPVAPDPPLPLFQYDPEVCATQKKRLDQAFQKIFHRPSIVASSHNYEIIISHSTVIRYFICKLLQIDPATWERFFVPHCSISWVKILGNGVISIKSVGETGHLSSENISV